MGTSVGAASLHDQELVLPSDSGTVPFHDDSRCVIRAVALGLSMSLISAMAELLFRLVIGIAIVTTPR